MAGLYEGLEVLQPPKPPKVPSLYEGLEVLSPSAPQVRQPVGFTEHVQAGFQGSALGLAWRRKLPELVMDPEHSKWWERLAAGVTMVGSELPLMIPAGAAGGAAGTAAGGPVGGILAGGAAMFATPAGIRTSLTEFYKARDGNEPADWFNSVREVAKAIVKEGAIGAVTMGTGAVARGGAAAVLGGGAEVSKAVGLGTATMATRGAARATGVTDVAGQIAAMVTMPAALEGRLPKAHEFLDAAGVILVLKGAHVALERSGTIKTIADRVASVYEKTGRTPAEQVSDAQADPRIAAELAAEPPRAPLKLDRLIAEAEQLARGSLDPPSMRELIRGVDRVQEEKPAVPQVPPRMDALLAEAEALGRAPLPEAPRVRDLIKELKDKGRLQTDITDDLDSMYGALDRLSVLQTKAEGRPERVVATPEGGVKVPAKPKGRLTDAEKTEREELRARVAELEERLKKVPTAEEFDASAKRVEQDTMQRLNDLAVQRAENGLSPLYDHPPEAIAKLIATQVRTFANLHGVLPEAIYAERFPQFTDASRVPVAEAEGAFAQGKGNVLLQRNEEVHRAAYQVTARMISTFEKADQSSILHELGHHFLEDLKHFAIRPGAPARVVQMWDTARREFAIGESGDISTAAHELMAKSFERYLADGVAPTPALKGMFEQFKSWMLQVYKDIRNIVGVRINPGVKGLFDRMLATEEEITAARELNVPRAYVAEAKATEARKIVPGFKSEQLSMEPYADELPTGPGQAPGNTHVNYAFINTPLDVKLTMQRMAEIDQANIQAQRGGVDGVKTWEQSNAEQAKYINDILGGSEDTLRILSARDPNAAGPDVRLGIMKKLMIGSAKESARLRDVILEKGEDATLREQVEYLASIERMRILQAEFLGERASVARAMNALKDVTEGSGEIGMMLEVIGDAGRQFFQDPKTMAEQAFLKQKLAEILLNYQGKSTLDIARLHKEVGTLKGTFKAAKDLDKASTWEKVVEAWKAGLLSGPQTPITNIVGTASFQWMRPPLDAIAAVIGIVRGAKPGMGDTDRVSMAESFARITGMMSGLQDGVKAAYHAFKADEPTGKVEAYRHAIPGTVGRVVRLPYNLMSAGDALTTTMYNRGEIHTLAIRQAFDEGLNPKTREFGERVEYLKDNPTQEMAAEADVASTRMAFNAPLGEKGAALQHFVNKWNLQWMVPFIRTPINIAKEMARMTPLSPLVGEWRADFAKGGVARDRAIAEVALGTALMTWAMSQAFDGQISGGGSPDPGKNRGKAGVWQPYSRLIDDTWYEYGRLQPMGTLVGLAADMTLVWDHLNDDEKDKIPKMLARAFSNAVTNQTFLQGIVNVVNATSDPTRFGPRFMQQLAGSMVPNVIGQPTTMADPYVREVNSMLEAVQARLPGMRQELLPKRDWLGDEVRTKERVGGVLPIREQKVSEDKVRTEAARLDISMADAPKKTHIGKGTGKLGDVELTPEERDTFEKVGGEMAHRLLTGIVNAPGYNEIPDLIKRNIFSRVLTASHKVAAVAALPMDKRVAYIQSITEKVQAALTPAETQ